MTTKKWSLFIKYVFILLLLFLALVLLTPRNWEPKEESWKQWAAARILRDTHEFPVIGLGPLYVTYLQLFSPLPYPWSIQVEYILTHMFTYFVLFLLLRKLVPTAFALLFTIAWIPHLAIIEPGGAILGIGMLAIYLIPGKSYLRNDGYLPPPLLAAALSHSIYIPFLLGHSIGKLWQWEKNIASGNLSEYATRSAKNVKMTLLVILLSLAVLTFVQPSQRIDHNHMLMDPTYAPVALKNPFTLAFFQYGNNHYVKQTFPKEEWFSQDWYFTNSKAYQGATTIFSATIKAPARVTKNIITNLGLGIQLPSYFFMGKYLGLISIILWIFPLAGMLGFASVYLKDKPKIFSIFFGATTVVICLTLTAFNSRYIITLLPIWLLIFCHYIEGAQKISEKFREYGKHHRSLIQKLVLGGGVVCIAAAFFLNIQFITSHVVPYSYENMRPILRLQILLFRIILGIIGIFLIVSRRSIILKIFFAFQKIIKWNLYAQKSYAKKGMLFLVSLSSFFLLLTSPYHGFQNQFTAVLEGYDFLSGDREMSMVDASPEIKKILTNKNAKTDIFFAQEHLWITAFTDIDITHIQQIWSLPPFKSETAESTLEKADVIMVSKVMTQERASLGTQSYLRYKLHIKPFLEKKMKEDAMLKKELPEYGTIYIKKKD